MKRMRLIKETYLGLVLSCLLFVLYLFAGCSKGGNSEGNNHDGDVLSGGLATAFNATRGAFNFPVPNLYPDELKKHLKGGAVFQALFVPPPAALSPGLGPIFNNKLCVACHIKNGRGKLDANLTTIFFRVSIPGESEFGGPNPVPGFGTQIQNKALLGTQPEAGVIIEYIKIEGQYPDGTNYSLRKPVYKISNPYVSLPDDILLSPRVAPSVFGMGLLEAIPEETILAVADPDDANGDGISGKPNWVWDFEKSERTIGRFGWKANNPTIFQQSASAFNEDMGVTNPLFPQENSFGQVQYDGRNDDPEIGFESVDAVAFYVRTLAVPARRNADDPEVKRGQKVFEQAKCSSCHITTLKTGKHPIKDISNQLIHPYTDLLLHDMGEGLADGRPDFEATGSEWRTPPLWGIGLVKVVNHHTNFLHDGRARNLEEAILWHGGEAERSKEFFINLSAEDRGALIKFLDSL